MTFSVFGVMYCGAIYLIETSLILLHLQNAAYRPILEHFFQHSPRRHSFLAFAVIFYMNIVKVQMSESIGAVIHYLDI